MLNNHFCSFASQPITPNQTPPPFDSYDDNGPSTPAIESSFYDPRVTWDTANPTASPELQRTPRPVVPSTPVRKPAISAEVGGNKDLNTPAAKLFTSTSLQGIGADEPTLPMEPSMRTPPPTNTANAKRKEKQNGPSRAHKRSESSNRQILPKLTDAGPSNTTDEPLHFTPLAFNTPDLFNQNVDLPATAPLYPQQKLFWDNDPNGMELDFSTDNPFATPRPQGLEPFVSAHESNAPLQQGTFLDFDGMLANPDYNTVNASTTLDGQMSGFGLGVDPSLLFTSSNAAATSLQAPVENESLQPYAYQMQEARREQAYAGISKAKRRRKPSVDSPAVVAALETLRDKSGRPNIRRSVTDTYVPRSGRSSSSSSRAGTSHGGRSSPLKQFRSETKRQHRQSVGLVIGSDGRARLEPVIHQDRGGSSRDGKDMDVDSTAYSSESESTESDDNDDDADSHNAMVTSFSSETASGTGMPKLGRFSSTGPHSQKSSYSSLYSSNSEPSKTRKPTSKRDSRHILDPVKEGGSFEDDRRQEADNAQAALMHSMKASQRGRYSPQKQSSGLEPFVSSPSTNTMPDSGFGAPLSAYGAHRTTFR